MPGVDIQPVDSMFLAAVHRQVMPGKVADMWRPALDLVWAFLRAHSEVPHAGLNAFLYHHPLATGGPMLADFGVQVTQAFEGEGEVRCITTPAGRAAVVTHAGSFDRLADAHQAIAHWMQQHGEHSAGQSLECYGHWHDDPQQLRTRVIYFLAEEGSQIGLLRSG